MAGYKVTRSNEREGKTHKVTGPDGTIKYFGDPNLKNKPNNPEAKSSWYARHAKSLAANPHFRAYARETWADGGIVEDYTEEDDINMAQGGKLKKGDPDTYITEDGKETRRGLWANVHMKREREERKMADGGEVDSVGTSPLKKMEVPESIDPVEMDSGKEYTSIQNAPMQPVQDVDSTGMAVAKAGVPVAAGAIGTAFGGPIGGVAASIVAGYLMNQLADGGLIGSLASFDPILKTQYPQFPTPNTYNDKVKGYAEGDIVDDGGRAKAKSDALAEIDASDISDEDKSKLRSDLEGTNDLPVERIYPVVQKRIADLKAAAPAPTKLETIKAGAANVDRAKTAASAPTSVAKTVDAVKATPTDITARAPADIKKDTKDIAGDLGGSTFPGGADAEGFVNPAGQGRGALGALYTTLVEQATKDEIGRRFGADRVETLYPEYVRQRDMAIAGASDKEKGSEALKAKADNIATNAVGVYNLNLLAGDARTAIEREQAFRTAAPQSAIGSPGVQTLNVPVAGDIAASTLVNASPSGMGMGPANISAPAQPTGDVQLPADFQEMVSNPETRYTQDTFNNLATLSSRPQMVFSTALKDGVDSTAARKMAIDDTIAELTSPKLGAMPGYDQAANLARQGPELTAMREAAQQQAMIQLRQSQIADDEARATTQLRQAQSDLLLQEAVSSEAQRAKLKVDRDRVRKMVMDGVANFDTMVTDVRSRNTLTGLSQVMAFIGTTLGGTVNPYELARTRANDEVNSQIKKLETQDTYLGKLITEGKNFEDAVKETDAFYKQLFGFQLAKASMSLRDEKARLEGLAAANKLIYESAKTQEELVDKQVKTRFEPYKAQAAAALQRTQSIFQYIKEGGDIKKLEADLQDKRAERASKSADRNVRQRELSLAERKFNLELDEYNDPILQGALSGTPVATSELAEFMKRHPTLRQTLSRRVAFDKKGKVAEVAGYSLAKSEQDKKAYDDGAKVLKQAAFQVQELRDVYRAAGGDWNKAIGDAKLRARLDSGVTFLRGLLSDKEFLNTGVPSGQEREDLTAATPSLDSMKREEYTLEQLNTYDRLFSSSAKNLEDAYLFSPNAASKDPSRYTGVPPIEPISRGGTAAAAPAPQSATIKMVNIKDSKTGKVKPFTRTQADAILADPNFSEVP
jgi:hypothetical protein